MEEQRNMSEKAFDQKFEELKKNGINTENIAFKTEEELVAEITSAYMSVHMENMDTINDKDDLANHKAYINSWASLLKEDKDLIFDCFSKAEKATEYLTNAMEKWLDKNYNKELNIDEKLNKLENEVKEMENKEKYGEFYNLVKDVENIENIYGNCVEKAENETYINDLKDRSEKLVKQEKEEKMYTEHTKNENENDGKGGR